MTAIDPGQPVPQRRGALVTIRRVLPYLWPQEPRWVRVRVVASLVALALAQAFALITPFFYRAAVDALAPSAHGTGGLVALGALGLTAAYGLSRLLNTGMGELRDALFVRVGQRALRQLALETFTHIHRLSMRYHITRKTGGLSRVIERGVKGIDFLLRFTLFSVGPLIVQLLIVLTVFATLFTVWYALVVAVSITLYVLFTFRVTEWRVQIRREMNAQDTDANQKAIDSLLNFETVKYFGAEPWEAARYDQAMAGYEKAAVKTGQSLAFLNGGQALIINTALVIVMAMAALGVQQGRLTVGDFVMVNAYMMQITQPLGFLGTVYREIRQSLIDMADMFDLLDQPAEITDAPEAKPLQVAGGEVLLDNVFFGYESARPILKGVSIRVPAGQSVAIVGPSGSGKSTIGRLLFRFYEVTGGAVRIDGQDVRGVTQDSLHAAIGVVPQDTVLFNDTILYNIAYGRPSASREEIEAAAKAAKIHDFVLSLPEGYETKVGERGLKLSGGEKQRVGIARTLLKNPPILLLDEATSALDTQTERDIQESLEAMGKGRTVITIAHRLSTIADSDRIVVLEQGVVVEEGRHEELLARGGRYAAMWNRQSAEAEEAA